MGYPIKLGAPRPPIRCNAVLCAEKSTGMAGATDGLREQGNAEFRNGDFLKAAATYTRAIKANPGSAVLYSNRSLALMKLNKLSKALSDAEQCTKLDPANAKGWFRRAQILEAQGHLEEAVQVLKEGTEAAGSGEQELGRQVKALTRKLKGCGTSGGAGAAAAAGDAKAAPGIKAMAATGVCENGGKAPASAAEAAALAFADSWIAYAQEQLRQHGTDFAPTVHFMPGSDSNTPEEPHEAASVQGKGAFADPAALADFVNFLRRKGEELAARAVVSIVPKAAVAFPQMWLQQLWPYSREQDGVFVQLQAVVPGQEANAKPAGASKGGKGAAAPAAARRRDAPKARADQGASPGSTEAAVGAGRVSRLWFARLGEAEEGGRFRVRALHELPCDLALLPSLLR